MVAKAHRLTPLETKGFSRLACIFGVIFALLPMLGSAAEVAVPNYMDPRERIAVPDLSSRSRIRFLTSVDFPPFSFLDRTGRLSGFHVDLARAICDELSALDKCQIQALPWSELGNALGNAQGEALIAGIAVTAENRDRYRFTRPYLALPARFVIRGDAAIGGTDADALAARRVGVLAHSAHEAMLRNWFPDIRPVTFDRADWMFDALRKGGVDAVYGDGVQLSFWLSSAGAEGCCRFFDGPFLSVDYLGEGLAIAVAPDNQPLADAFDHALAALNRSGRFAELYLRWFPNGLY
ncbi:amino acid ABC transporter substrate-binding protein (PAAT family) [Hoeflea marina]|uniref:Amino acid ABC transporter substrate-binding protein (PAAT family) n=1 Tax=Hoeflea marina TaxID=274592 RepID=A0A317PLI9_9HYPH|nr:amino acid ABC transporter substrate-binding protein (PAAT family) [Hoeflea marina]